MEFPDSHLSWLEDHMTHVIMGPVTVEDPPFLLQSFLEGRSWKGSENGEGGKFDIVLLNKFYRFSKNARVSPLNPKMKEP